MNGRPAARNAPQHNASTTRLESASTIVAGSTVSLTTSRGEIFPSAVLGVFDRDVRFLSGLLLKIDGQPAPLLNTGRIGASSERVVALAALDRYSNGAAIVARRRTVQPGTIEEQIEVRSFQGARTIVVEFVVEADGASILSLKSAEPPPPPSAWKVAAATTQASCVARAEGLCEIRTDSRCSLRAIGTSLHLEWTAVVDANESWTATWTASYANAVAIVFPTHLPRLDVVADDHRWAPAIATSVDDLEALVFSDAPRGDDGSHSGSALRFIAAGAPWFLAMFGRDALIAAWQSLPLGTGLALDVLDALASYQGTTHDQRRLEGPGKILHERRLGTPQVFGMGSGETYFGTVDASPLFVVLLAEAYRWGAPHERIASLLPAARRAMSWCIDEATRLGPEAHSSFLWYSSDGRGLRNQAWKDSGDCMVHADGSLASGPLAVAEVQGYFYDALIGLARLEEDFNDGEGAARLNGLAMKLKADFASAFWNPRTQLIAMALDGTGVPLAVASSNMGQCLWSGILDEDVAASVGERVMCDDLCSPWGIRTLGDSERAYNPLGYHLGSVWAHDSALIAAGMARHGMTAHVRTIAGGVLNAAEGFGWRLPELYGGLDTRDERGRGAPLPYPAACSPQAWSAGAPLLLLRSVLGLQPDVPRNTTRAASALVNGRRLIVDGIMIGGRAHRIAANGSDLAITPID